jgi:hypothetical protein
MVDLYPSLHERFLQRMRLHGLIPLPAWILLLSISVSFPCFSWYPPIFILVLFIPSQCTMEYIHDSAFNSLNHKAFQMRQKPKLSQLSRCLFQYEHIFEIDQYKVKSNNLMHIQREKEVEKKEKQYCELYWVLMGRNAVWICRCNRIAHQMRMISICVSVSARWARIRSKKQGHAYF